MTTTPDSVDALRRLRKEALDIFDGPECSQEVRDVIEWHASSISVILDAATQVAAGALSNEQAAFERASRGSDLRRFDNGTNDYRNPEMQACWEGWQMRAALSAPQGAQIDPAYTALPASARRLAAADTKGSMDVYMCLKQCADAIEHLSAALKQTMKV